MTDTNPANSVTPLASLKSVKPLENQPKYSPESEPLFTTETRKKNPQTSRLRGL
ncbi:MAG: hypothetical protein AAF901_14950 [Bacteroidota bacterium]